MNTLIIGVETKGAKEAATELDHLAKSGEKAEKKTKGVGKGAGQTVAPFKAMRGATQQASFQLQDIAVQAQSGTDAFIILGQQGPQLASIFGSGGAIFGAVIAFGALIGGLLVSQFNNASEAFEALEEDMQSLGDKFDALGPAAKEYERSLSVKKVENFDKAIAELSKEQEKGIKLTYNHATGQAVAGETTEAYTERQQKLAAEIERLNALKDEEISRTDDVTQATLDAAEADRKYTEKLRDEYAQLTLTGDELLRYNALKNGASAESLAAAVALQQEINAIKAKNEADKEAARIKEAKTKADDKAAQQAKAKREVMIAAAQKNLTVIEQSLMSERELIAAYAAEDIARLAADRDAGLISLQEFTTAKAQIELDAANKSVALVQTEEEQKKAIREQLQSQVIGQAGQLAGQLAGMAKAAYGEESAAYKAAFLVQQGIAIASAIMSTQVAAAAALAPPPIGLGPIAGVGLAGSIQAMGAVNVGIIAGQTVAGLARANGGQVRGGESYLVGERGPELLTMGTSGRIATNENLKRAVNSDEGSSKTQNVNVNFNIMANDTKGFDALLNSRRGQIVSMVNRAVNNSGKAKLT